MRKREKREAKKQDRGIVDFMMVTSLIRGKQFNRNRLLGKYWRVIFDGTGLFCFKEKHCENCLCTDGKDGRARGMFQFYGASRSSRWAGRIIQLQI